MVHGLVLKKEWRMGDEQLRGVDVFVRVGENEELLIATIRDASSTSEVLRSLALELERLAGPVRLAETQNGATGPLLEKHRYAPAVISEDFYGDPVS